MATWDESKRRRNIKDHGFDFIEGPNQGCSETAAVAKFLAARDPAKPLCLFVGTRHPHTVWSADRTYDPAAVKIPPTHVDTAVTREERASYLTDVTKADTLLGEVRALVREKLSADTLFIYTADHGGAWPFGKWTLYDAGIRVPLIMAWPARLKPGIVSDAMVCWPDLLPTFIELAGGTVPAGIDGKSFAAILRGTARRIAIASSRPIGRGQAETCNRQVRGTRDPRGPPVI